MIFFLLMWCFVGGIGLLYWRTCLYRRHMLLHQDAGMGQHLTFKVASWFSKKHWFNTPGGLVRWYCERESVSSLLKSYDEMSFEKLQRIKQSCVFLFWLFCIAWLLFGSGKGSDIVFLLFVGVVLFFFPEMWIKSRLTKRKRQAYQDIPSFLDMLVLALRSGMGVEQSLAFVAEKTQGVLGVYTKKALLRLQWGQGFEEVLIYLQDVSLGEDMRHMVRSISQARFLGVSLSDTLDLQTDILRTKRRQHMETLSRTASVKMSLPLVFCIFPALLLLYLGPGILLLLQQ